MMYMICELHAVAQFLSELGRQWCTLIEYYAICTQRMSYQMIRLFVGGGAISNWWYAIER